MSKLSDVILRGTRAAQPAATTISAGGLYFVTDELVLERSSGTVWESVSPSTAVANDSITYAKMQNVSAASKLLGRGSAGGAGDPEEITLGTGLTMTGTTLAASGGAAGALVLLEQHTGAGSASLDFTTAFSSTYDEYLIEAVNLIPATNGVQGLIRFSTDGGATYDSGANYQWANSIQTPSGGTGFTSVASATGATSLPPAGTTNIANTAVGGGLRFSARLFDPLSATAHKALVGEGTLRNSGDSNHYRLSFAGYYISATAVNAMRFLFSSGNVASGTIRIYGVAK
jgi:hypothetical protein